MTSNKTPLKHRCIVTLITLLLAVAPAISPAAARATARATVPAAAPVIVPVTAPAESNKGDHYLLAKIGFMSIKRNDADMLASLGAVYGFGLSSRWSLEAEANLGVIGGEYTQKNGSIVIQSGDYRVSTLAGYGVFRHHLSASVFAKLKSGLLYEHVRRSGTDSNETSNGFGAVGGLGLGWRIGQSTTIEGEITGIDRKIMFYSIGFNSAFKW